MSASNVAISSNAGYELIYWPEIPGRGEYIRLLFEAAGVPYQDTPLDVDNPVTYRPFLDPAFQNRDNPPPFAPPVLRHGELVLWQTPNILMYLGQRLRLAPALERDHQGAFHVNALALTALDGLSNGAHDVHHPIAVMWAYEEQQEAAKLRAADFRQYRLPKWLEYFEQVLSSASSKGGEYLYGGELSYADLVLFQCLDGVSFAFPQCVSKFRASGQYEKVWNLYERIKAMERIQAYLDSERRRPYGIGLYRHYPELDGEE